MAKQGTVWQSQCRRPSKPISGLANAIRGPKGRTRSSCRSTRIGPQPGRSSSGNSGSYWPAQDCRGTCLRVSPTRSTRCGTPPSASGSSTLVARSTSLRWPRKLAPTSIRSSASTRATYPSQRSCGPTCRASVTDRKRKSTRGRIDAHRGVINLGADVPIRPHVNDVRLTDKDWGTFSFALGLRAGEREILETLLLYYVGVNVYRFESVEPAKARKMLRSYAKKMSVLAQALRKNTRTQLRFAYGNHDFISRLIQIRKKMMKFSEELTVLAAAVPKLEAGRKGGWTRGAVDVLTAWHLLSLARGGPGGRVRKVAPAPADPTPAFMQF